MRVLICAQEAPLGPVNGFRRQLVAATDALRGLYDIRILAALAPDQRPRPGMRLVPAAKGRRAAPPAAYDSSVRRLRTPLQEEVREFAPDLVYVAGVRLAKLGRELGDVPTVIAPLDAAHLSVEAQAAAARWPARVRLRAAVERVRRFETAEYGSFDRVLVVSARDRDALRAAVPGLRLEVIPHPVDAAAFAPGAGERPDPRRIVLAGVMSAAPNVTAAEFLARRVLPLVRAVVPDAHLAIVGHTPPRRVRALGRLDGVRVVGEVADMAGWLAGSRACAAPMLTGSGVKNKLLEGMACGLACVVTPQALGGLRVVSGRELLVGENAAELARHLVRVLEDDGLAAALGVAARAYVLAEHSSAAVAAELDRICAEVLAERQRSMSQVCSDRPPSTTSSAPVT